MIQAVIFDMDGTLVDSENVSVRAWDVTAERAGVDLPSSLINSFIGRNFKSYRQLLADHVGSEELADKLLAMHVDDFEDLSVTDLELMAGAREALEALKETGVTLAVATSTRRDRAIPRLERFGIASYFSSFTCGDEVERSKPEPDIFLEAAARLGIDPSQCGVVEDSYNGVRAGHAAGMHVFMVPDLVKPTEEIVSLCDAVLPTLHELPAAVAAVR